VEESIRGFRCYFLCFINRRPHSRASYIVMAISAVLYAQHESARHEALNSELEKLGAIVCGAFGQNISEHGYF